MRSSHDFPAHFSSIDRARALALFDASRGGLRPYNGSWTCDWMLNGAFEPEWTIITSRSQYRNGAWSDLRKFSWDIYLPDGTSLLDAVNARMLSVAQKNAFLARELPNGGISAATTLLGFLYLQATLIRWIYLHRDIYKPAQYTFRRLTGAAIEEFLRMMSQGGVPWALGYPTAFLNFCYAGAGLGACTGATTPEALDSRDVAAIVRWLDSEGFYRQGVGKESFRFIDRRKLANVLGFELHTIKSHDRFAAFLRQFEPTVVSPLLIGREHRRELPSHSVRKVSEVLNQPMGLEDGTLANLRIMLRQHRHLPDDIPDSSTIDFARIARLLPPRTPNHTPWIPLDVSLKYTTEALRWVHSYGADLVEYYIRVTRALHECAATEKIYANQKKREKLVRRIPVPKSLAQLNISGWTSALANNTTNYSQFRKAPAVGDALSVLVGAIIILVACVKPSRESELGTLKRGCVYFRSGDGYWVNTKLAKSGAQDVQLDAQKPIPVIVAKALALAMRLTDGLHEILGEASPSADSPLFLVPERDAAELVPCTPLSSMRLNAFVDKFCDWVNLPPDSLGRRWYVRVHELRKSFLITFFWCYRFAGLDAARWIAGHTNSADVYAYIEANFPGEELPALEAQYAAQQLWAFQGGQGQWETDNTEELYQAVCTQFRVTTLDLVPENDLIQWLSSNFRDGSLLIEPYSVRQKGEITGTRICFRISKTIA